MSEIRDYCYFSEYDHASESVKDGFFGYRFKFEINFVCFYIDILIIIAYLYRIFWGDMNYFQKYFNNNPILLFITSIIIFAPYYFAISIILKKLESIQVPKTLSTEKYEVKQKISISVLIISMLSMGLVIFIMELLYKAFKAE